MIGLCEMENEAYEALILPYVNRVVNEDTNRVSYELKRRFNCYTVDLRESPNDPPTSGFSPRKVFTPEGIFSSARAAADHFGVTKEAIYMRINKARKSKNVDWGYLKRDTNVEK